MQTLKRDAQGRSSSQMIRKTTGKIAQTERPSSYQKRLTIKGKTLEGAS